MKSEIKILRPQIREELSHISSFQVNYTIYTDGLSAGARNGGAAAVITAGPPTQPTVALTIKGLTIHQFLKRRPCCHGIRFIGDFHKWDHSSYFHTHLHQPSITM